MKSAKPGKQRKMVFNAPLHMRHKLLGARLSKELTKSIGRRSLPVRKGDEVKVARGKYRGAKGTVAKVDLKATRIYIDGIKRKKVSGEEAMLAMHPSNVIITKAEMEDKKRAKQTGKKGETK